MNDDERSVEREGLRAWLRVPNGCALPTWAASLAPSVARERELRRGLALADAVIGVVDLETTGLSTRTSRILEIGLVVARGSERLGCFETLVDVGAPLSLGITALTGIDDSLLLGAPSEAEAIGEFARWLTQFGVDALVAHNARFDRAFLARAWRDHACEPALPPFLCSLRLARRCVAAPSYGLDALVAQLAIPGHARHRALGDAETTAALWRELVGRAGLTGVNTLEALEAIAGLRKSGPPRRRVRVVEADA